MRVIMLVTPQAAAAPRISTKGRTGALAARSIPITARPANATAAPDDLLAPRPLAQHERRRTTIVKITCSWSSSEESPAGMPEVDAHEQQPELDDAEQEAEAEHDLPRHARAADEEDAGTAISVKRSALNSSGGKWSSPTWMTTKFTPQMAVDEDERARRSGRACARMLRADDASERVDIPLSIGKIA